MPDEELISELYDFLREEEVIYLYTDQDIFDFRKEFKGNVCIHSKKEFLQVKLPKITTTFSNLFWGLFKDKILLTYDIKRLFSYFYYRLPRHFYITTPKSIHDICYLDKFHGTTALKPQSLTEAKKRIKSCKVHQSIHIPLAIKTLPKIETLGFADKQGMHYSAYEIEGQTNGRLGCKKEWEEGIAVHHIEKERFIPYNYTQFLCADYKAAEVVVLAWLSGDERLNKIIKSGRDIYSTIAMLFGAPSRSFIKDIFLPIHYGMQTKTISERMNISIEEAKEYYAKMYKFFGEAMEYLDDCVKRMNDDPVSTDYFGRNRNHKENLWGVRNSIIQSVAAIFFQEKLIKLQQELPNVFANTHDAYYLYIEPKEKEEVVKQVRDILESNSEICVGLKSPKVEIKTGDRLHLLERVD